MSSSEVLEAANPYSWYSIGSLKAKIRLENGFKIIALLNTRAEINLIIKELIKNAGLAMRCGAKLELVFHTDHSHSFPSLCEDVEVAIEDLKIRYPIFVIETGNHDLIFGQSFLNLVKFSQEYKSDRNFGTITYLTIYQSTIFQTLLPQDPANRKEN